MARTIPSSGCFLSSLLTVQDESEELCVIDFSALSQALDAIASVNSSKKLSLIPDIDKIINDSLVAVDVAFASIEDYRTLLETFECLTTDSEMDYFTAMLAINPPPTGETHGNA